MVGNLRHQKALAKFWRTYEKVSPRVEQTVNQGRLARIYRITDSLFFSVSAGNLGNGLDGQLQEFMKQHNDTRLIIIDTLQIMIS